MTDKTYADTACERYGGRIEAMLARYATALGGGTVDELHDAEYRWSVVIAEGVIDVSATILEQAQNDGDGDGIALLIDIVTDEGRPIGSFCPGNYTDALWTDLDGFEARLAAAESIDVDDVRALIVASAD
jgi:hypothetical protein